jgi:LPS export ABC transporter protein LptC
MEYPEGLTVYNYNANMEIESKMSANYGISYEKKEEVMVRDNVILVNIKGEKLNSEELWWNRQSKKITSDKFVKVTTIDEEIIGYGFDANEDYSEYTVRNVKMITTIDDPNLD